VKETESVIRGTRNYELEHKIIMGWEQCLWVRLIQLTSVHKLRRCSSVVGLCTLSVSYAFLCGTIITRYMDLWGKGGKSYNVSNDKLILWEGGGLSDNSTERALMCLGRKGRD
jgi:hypothetical protein